ncbi:E3 ubiquitin-protein ligase UBR2 [Onthophagus taurus]|uniref:E3 ubiquitin-protein ligase UBR2 n=1 Tax=Onthophagus taurus TaxID=166361 RepID=UPI0039BE739A
MDDIVDVEMISDQEMVTKEIVKKWMEKFEEGVLSSSHFKEYWRTWVPRLYSPGMNDNCLHFNFNEDEASRKLFQPLEEFICNGDPVAVWQQLTEKDKKPSVCGRVFKHGEPTYSCRECGMDNTCVLCVNCFKKSEHRNHKYKMGASCGGGCCDCGDTEAWKKDPYCETHALGLQHEQLHVQLPESLVERTRIVYDAVLWYAYNLLTLEHSADFGLKSNLDEDDLFDAYCTVLYNDESHTFEQVISTLNRVIKCPQRTAIEYVTNIDREGRAIVKCSDFQHCSNLKSEIEKYTSRHGNKPLKVLVVHAHVVAHQIFAMKLLSWLQTFLGHGEGFRSIFSEIALKPQQADPCIIKGILLRDSQLWKSARTHWHTLIISGMLLEYENKKAFAKIFMKNFGNVMKDFIKDDHEHTFSISSLSVQIFTVPTIAHHLIANDDALFILLNTFISECSRKCNKNGKLEFERNATSQTFKRAQYMLYDLRYLLSSVPQEWSDDLRINFLQGLSLLLKLLTMMQGMDSVVRQVGQHMEYEPEWETAFNLHIKLAYCISLALEWCGSDRVVLIKAYRLTLKQLHDHPCNELSTSLDIRELADHTVTCLHYDVASKPVSIHLPLSRFLAGLHLHLEKYNLSFDGAEFKIDKPTPVEIIEPVLRTQVMIAQVHAGMWRRNGYALLNQLYFYHNAKCRSEMLDRDIILLQIGATLIESNDFMIHLLNKYNLCQWASLNFESGNPKQSEEDSIRQTITLVEEFLQLLIVIIGERWVPGISKVSQQERIKKEIIQHLCIKPLLHSELYKIVPENIVPRDTGIDDVTHDIAKFKKPTQGTGQGVYELKDPYFEQYNIFFYHYTREELSKSEEAQRKRRKAAGELECCPPPQLPKLSENFSLIVNLLQCDVMLHIMQTVLERSVNLRAVSFSELQLHKVLHLIGYALQEEQTGYYPFLIFSEKSVKYKLQYLLEELSKSPRVEAHKDLIKWTLNLYKQVGKNVEVASEQISMESEQEKEDKEKERRAKLAAQRREKIMAQMAAMQNSFIKEHAKLFQETNSELTDKEQSNIKLGEPSSIIDEKLENNNTALLGKHKKIPSVPDKYYVCILCQEEQKVTAEGPALVLAAFVHQATVLCRNRNVEHDCGDPLFLNSDLGPAPYTSTCGHVMHSACWQRYFVNVMQKENRRPYRLRHPASFDIEKQEFLCPLCECLSNTAIPLLPSLTNFHSPSKEGEPVNFSEWLTAINDIVRQTKGTCHGSFHCKETASNPCLECENIGNYLDCGESCEDRMHQICIPPNFEELQSLGDKKESFKEIFPISSVELSDNLQEIIDLYAQAPYTRGLNVGSHPDDRRIAPMAWKSCAYTIHTIEMILRDANKPLLGNLSSRHRDCIESLVRVMAVLGNTCLTDKVIASHAAKLLSLLIACREDDPSILEWDSFGFLVSLTFSLPSIFTSGKNLCIPTGGTLELHTARLLLTVHIVKILVLKSLNDGDRSMEVDGEVIDYTPKIISILTKECDDWKYYYDEIKRACIPFLRCMVLLYQHLTDHPPGEILTEVGGDTYENICVYLGLPTDINDLFIEDKVLYLVNNWLKHPELKSLLTCQKPAPQPLEPLAINKLVELPVDYSELINTVSSFTCPNRDHDDSRNPTMCLVCGEILCSQNYCCQTEVNKVVVGACNYHAYKCGAGVGIFLRIRDCEILFLASPNRGLLLAPPYLDDYGETDQGLKRGNPLKLSQDLYKKFQNMWLNHTIHEEIARSIESSNISNILPTMWQHL